jgi:hypothetical protein
MLLHCESLEPPRSQLGSIASNHNVCDVRSSPNATVMLQCHDRSKSAITGCEQSQQNNPYSITSSVMASNLSDTVRPSALAVL